MKRNRLTDNDINLGPLTIGAADNNWKPIGITLDSGSDEYPGCSLNLYTGWRTFRLALPPILKPWRNWVDTSRYSWSTNPRGGYWDIHHREYGFRLSGGFLQVFLGPQTMDSVTTKSWCTHLPWTQWRHVRHSLYGLQGEHYWTEQTKPRADWDDWHKAKEAVPKAHFFVRDHDGEHVVASTLIEEREWHFGESWCRWLSVFRRPRIRRSLDINFDREVGGEKGSWKGGLMGTSIELLPGEMHERAFRRFCEQPVRGKYGQTAIIFVGPATQADVYKPPRAPNESAAQAKATA